MQVKSLRDDVAELKADAQLQTQKFEALFEQAAQRFSEAEQGSANGHVFNHNPSTVPQATLVPFLTQVFLTLFVIGLSHWLLLFVYDAPPIQLRVWTILWPALPGFILAYQSNRGWRFQAITSVWVGLSSVALMLSITAHIDLVPFWPTNARDWKEVGEYAAAISLSFFTGFLILKQRLKVKSENNRRISLSVLLERDKNGQFQIAEISKQVNSLITSMAPLVSTATALYSGLKAFSSD